MNNFKFHAITDIRFGKGAIQFLPEVLTPHGKKVLMVYGGGSIKKSGLYDEIVGILKDFEITELPGIEPNPKIESVREGAKICKEKGIDVVLAVGGGSCIDASKSIAGGAVYDGDPWEFVEEPTKIKAALPIVTVLTLAATGSEMNKTSVISNMALNKKIGTASPHFQPRASILDPTYLFTLPKRQTAAGTADIMSHVLEQYFQPGDAAYLSDRFCESVLKTCIKYCPIALAEPDNYEARANLMWASTIGLNSILSCGKGGVWSCHPMEHELSAFYDVNHGEGLAILTPRWMEYALNEETMPRFCMYARNVWNLEGEDSFALAKEGIKKTYQFFAECGMPMTLPEIGIDESKITEMARQATRRDRLLASYVPMNAVDVENILKECLHPATI